MDIHKNVKQKIGVLHVPVCYHFYLNHFYSNLIASPRKLEDVHYVGVAEIYLQLFLPYINPSSSLFCATLTSVEPSLWKLLKIIKLKIKSLP